MYVLASAPGDSDICQSWRITVLLEYSSLIHSTDIYVLSNQFYTLFLGTDETAVWTNGETFDLFQLTF